MDWTPADRLSPTGQKLVQYFKSREAALLTQLRSRDQPESITQFVRGQLYEGEALLRQFTGELSSNS